MPKVMWPSGIREVCHLYNWHREKRTGNSLTRSKARKGFPVRVGAHTEWAAWRLHSRAACQRGRSSLRARSNEPNCERLSRMGNRVLPRSARRNRRWVIHRRKRRQGREPLADRKSLTGGPSSDLTTNLMCVTNRGRSTAACGVVPAVRASALRAVDWECGPSRKSGESRSGVVGRRSGQSEASLRVCTARQS
jgi:hypothetical protein